MLEVHGTIKWSASRKELDRDQLAETSGAGDITEEKSLALLYF